MIERGVQRNRDKLMSVQIMEEIHQNPEDVVKILSHYNVSPDEFGDMLGANAREWGRKLGLLGHLSKKLSDSTDPETRRMVEGLRKVVGEPTVWDKFMVHYQKWDGIRRGLLVTQLSTAVRNAMTQVGRIGIDVVEEAMNATLQKTWKAMGGKVAKGEEVEFADGLDTFISLFRKNKATVEQILGKDSKDYNRLFGTYMADVSKAQGKEYAKQAVDILNWANRFQEGSIRRGVFMAKLRQEVGREGKDLMALVKDNKVSEISEEAIGKAIDKALEYTWAQKPKWGTWGADFVRFINRTPGASLVVPFPRFMMNSIKFTAAYSPLGVMRFVNPAEWTKIANGNFSGLSKAMMGSGLFFTAYQMRKQMGEDTKWYEWKRDDGSTIDLRPFNPFAAHLYAADQLLRWKEGRLYKLKADDIAQAVLGANVRAGTGLFLVDQALDALTKEGDSSKAGEKAKQFAGEVVGGVVTPLQTIKELMDGFDETIVRDKRQDPWLGPAKAKIPGLAETLPEKYIPTREGPLKSSSPAKKQLLGQATNVPKNAVERELDRLQFDYREVMPSLGDPKADNLVKKHMGEIVGQYISPLLEDDDWRSQTDAEKGVILREMLREARRDAMELAMGEDPDLFEKLEIRKIPDREKMLLREMGLLER